MLAAWLIGQLSRTPTRDQIATSTAYQGTPDIPKLPVVPGIIRGTRSMLRSDQWFPRWSLIGVTIERPIEPKGTELGDVVQMRDRARSVILAGCGEPDLSELIKRPKLIGSN